MSIKKTLVFAMAFMFLLVPMSANQTVFAEEEVTLTFWDHQFPPLVEFIEDKIEIYEEENPHVNIEFTIDFRHERIIPAMFAGEGPDISAPHGPRVYQLMVQDYLAPVDLNAFPEFDSYQELEEAFWPGALEPFKMDGEIYSLPFEMPIGGLLLNKGLFEKAGLDFEENIPETWEDVGEIGGIIMDSALEQDPIEYEGFDWYYHAAPWQREQIATIFAQYDAAFVNQNNEAVVNSPEAIEAFQMMKDMIHVYETGDPDRVIGADSVDWQFFYGNIAMVDFIAGPLGKMNIEFDEEDYYSVRYPQPAEREDPLYRRRTHSFMVNADLSEEEQYEAWRFVNFLTQQWDHEVLLRMNSPRINQPDLDVPWYETEWFQERKAEEPAFEGIPYDVLEEGRAVWVSLSKDLYGTPEGILRADEIRDVVGEAFERMIYLGESPETVLNQANEELQRMGFE